MPKKQLLRGKKNGGNKTKNKAEPNCGTRKGCKVCVGLSSVTVTAFLV